MWHRFWKGTSSCWESKQNECLCRSSRPKGSLRKMLWEILHNSQINHLFRNLFFDKVKLCRTATSLKTSLQRRCFLVKFAKYVGIPFLQNTTGRLLLIIAVSIVVKGKLAGETASYDTKAKGYAPIWARSVNYQKRTVLVKFEQVSEAVVGRCSSKWCLKNSANFTGKHLCLETLFN